MGNLVQTHNWLIYSVVHPELKKHLRLYAKGKLIDIGCGEKPYRSFTEPYVTDHIGVDHEGTQHDTSSVDIASTAYAIPVENESFDTVLCTYVLEHLEEPSRALAEAHRVLKPGGYAIYTVPLFWHLHEEPRDFYRYTPYGLKYLFESNQFEVTKIQPLCGFVVTFAQELVYYLYRFRRGGKLNPLWWLIPPAGMFIQLSAYLLNRLDHSYEFCAEYLLVARKPEAGS